MYPKNYHLDVQKLGWYAATVLSAIGAPKALMTGGEVQASEMPQQVADLLERAGQDYDFINDLCRSIMAFDGKENGLSKKELELFTKLHDINFNVVGCLYPRQQHDWLRNLRGRPKNRLEPSMGISYQLSSDGSSLLVFINDVHAAQIFNNYLRKTGTFMGITSWHTPGLADMTDLCQNFPNISETTAAYFKAYLEVDEGAPSTSSRLAKTIQEQFDNESIFMAGYLLSETSGDASLSMSEEGLKKRLEVLLLIDILRKDFNHNLHQAIQTLRTLRPIGFRNIFAFLHYFVNPSKYSRPSNQLVPGRLSEPLPSTLETVFIGSLSSSFRADPTFIPFAVENAATGSVRPLLFGIEERNFYFKTNFERGRAYKTTDASMVCVDRFEKNGKEYAIYATASHVINKDVAPNGFLVYHGRGLNGAVTLVAAEVASDRSLTPIKLASQPANSDFIFTMAGQIQIGSNPKWTDTYSSDEGGMTRYENASSSPGDIILFRGLNVPSDSGGAIIDPNGELIGIILGGDMQLTVAGFANMAELANAVADFKKELDKIKPRIEPEDPDAGYERKPRVKVYNFD